MADINSGQDVDILAGDNVIGRVKITDGTDVADVIDSGTYAGIGAVILDGSGNPITSFGGGTQYATNVAYADGNTGTLAVTVRDDALSTLTEADGDYSALRVDSTGALWVNLVETSLPVTNADITTLAGAVTSNRIAVNLISGQTGISASAGNVATTTPRVTLADNDPAVTAVQLIDDAIFTDDTSTHTPATTKVMGIGMVADDTSTDSVNEGDIGMPRMTLDRKQVVHMQPNATGGWTTKSCSSCDGSTALTNTAQVIKATAGSLGGWFVYNPNTTAAYIQLYNTAAASVTVGTTNPLFMITIPPGSASNVEYTQGIAFSNAGWSAAATSTAGGNGALTTALDVTFFYV
jgi:hypothetical protein